jgi:hypothetical protein
VKGDLDLLTVRTVGDGGRLVFERNVNVTADPEGQLASWPSRLRIGGTVAWFLSSRDGMLPVPMEIVVTAHADGRRWPQVVTIDPPDSAGWEGVLS